MKKLTKHQRHYRKKRKDSKRDFKKVLREDGKKGVQVTKKQLCVRVNEEAFLRLQKEAETRQITKQDMLTWMILKGLPAQAQGCRGIGTTGYSWPDHLLNSTGISKKNKGSIGIKQLNLAITSTAWKKLHCFSNAIGLSKARIVQDLILNYTFCSPKDLEKQKQYRKKSRERYDFSPRIPPTQEEIKAFYQALHKKMEEREQRLDQMMEAIKEDYEGRLSESEQDDS